MNVLVIGNGGREHALCYSIKQSPNCSDLYCIPGNFYLDPSYPVDLALITHSHTDHARPGNNKILATNDTINIMKIRYGKNYCNYSQKIDLDETINVNGINIKFISAGHIIGSAQIYLEYKGEIVIISGDYKRRKDVTCAPFEVKKCHTFFFCQRTIIKNLIHKK